MKPGIYKNIPNAEYHSGAGISKSGLDVLARSPLHYWAAYLSPDRQERRESPAFAIGTAIHTSILEPERFAAEYVQLPTAAEYPEALVSLDDYKTAASDLGLKKSGTKAELKAAILAADCAVPFLDDIVEAVTHGKTALSPQDMAACRAVAESLRTHPAAATILVGGEAEVSIYWEDPDTGVLCRCRPDYLRPDLIFDVKSTGDASPEGFGSSAWKYRYWVQAAFYLDGVKAATGDALPFVFGAWEKEAPYASAFYYAPDDMLAAGRAEYKRLLRLYASCMDSGHWPGYSPKIERLELPGYTQFQLAQRSAAVQPPKPVF